MQILRVGPIFRSSKSDCERLGDAAYTDLTESVSDRAGAATKDCTRRRARSTHLPSPGCPITFFDNHHARLNERFRENCPKLDPEASSIANCKFVDEKSGHSIGIRIDSDKISEAILCGK